MFEPTLSPPTPEEKEERRQLAEVYQALLHSDAERAAPPATEPDPAVLALLAACGPRSHAPERVAALDADDDADDARPEDELLAELPPGALSIDFDLAAELAPLQRGPAPRGGPWKGRERHWQIPFLRAYAATGGMREACRMARIDHKTVQQLRDRNPLFARLLADADAAYTERLEQAGLRRAERHSDTLMMFFLKARKKEVYGDQGTVNVNLAKLTDQDLVKLIMGQAQAEAAAPPALPAPPETETEDPL